VAEPPPKTGHKGWLPRPFPFFNAFIFYFYF